MPSIHQIVTERDAGSWIHNDYFDGPGLRCKDAFSMRELINDIDETIRMIRSGTLTGVWRRKMFMRHRKLENEMHQRYQRVKQENPDAIGLQVGHI